MEAREVLRFSLLGALALLIVWRASSSVVPAYRTEAPPGPEEILLLRSPRPVRIQLPGSPAVPQRAFSRWRCVGDLETVGAVPHRACLFERVCYHPNTSDFTFHVRTGGSTRCTASSAVVTGVHSIRERHRGETPYSEAWR